MTRLVAVLLLAAVGVLADAHEQEVPDQRAPGPQLHISAVAFDRENRPVDNLRASDLEVWIGGYRVPIRTLTVVTTSDAPAARSIVLLLDDRTILPDLIPGPGRSRASSSTGWRLAINRGCAAARRAHGIFWRTRAPAQNHRRREPVSTGWRRAAGRRRGPCVPDDRRVVAAARGTPGRPQDYRRHRRGAALRQPIPPPTVARSLRRESTEAMRATASAGAHVYVIDPAGLGAAPLSTARPACARDWRPRVPEHERFQRRRRADHE